MAHWDTILAPDDPERYPDLSGRCPKYCVCGQLPDEVLLWPTCHSRCKKWTPATMLGVLSRLFELPASVPPGRAFDAQHLPYQCMLVPEVSARTRSGGTHPDRARLRVGFMRAATS